MSGTPTLNSLCDTPWHFNVQVPGSGTQSGLGESALLLGARGQGGNGACGGRQVWAPGVRALRVSAVVRGRWLLRCSCTGRTLSCWPPVWQTFPVIPAEPTVTADRRSPRHVRIVQLSAPVFRALADGDLAAANAVSPVLLPEYFAQPAWRGTWQRRGEQVERDPASAAWVTGVIWDEQQQVAVGRAGYHGPPDPSGMVEIGYAVDPAYRRRGYARAALEALLHRAAHEPRVNTVRVTISPDNAASYALASQYGFAEVGEQWDEEDGLEIIYEVAASRYR
jgi:RimJ/RimL family protein N-acetyltransferase